MNGPNTFFQPARSRFAALVYVIVIGRVGAKSRLARDNCAYAVPQVTACLILQMLLVGSGSARKGRAPCMPRRVAPLRVTQQTSRKPAN